MKKHLIIWLFSWLLFPINCTAQSAKSFRFGLVGGGNASLIKKPVGYQSILWRYSAGFTVEQRFTGAVGAVYQLLYSRQGETVHSSGYNPVTGKTTDKQLIRFDYIALPIMLRVRPKGERAFLQAGGQIGYLINNTFQLASEPNQIRIIPHTQAIDVGITGGVGYRLGRHIVIDGRYYYGMRSVLADYTRVDPQTGGVMLIKNDRWYNRVWSVNLSYYY